MVGDGTPLQGGAGESTARVSRGTTGDARRVCLQSDYVMVWPRVEAAPLLLRG